MSDPGRWTSGNRWSVELSKWSREQDKIFENGVATYPEDSEDRWEKIAADIPERSVDDIKQHYELLLSDIHQIESGCVPLPCYDLSIINEELVGNEEIGKKGDDNARQSGVDGGKGGSRPEQERRKGIPWTEEEHRDVSLLQGLVVTGNANASSAKPSRQTASPSLAASSSVVGQYNDIHQPAVSSWKIGESSYSIWFERPELQYSWTYNS